MTMTSGFRSRISLGLIEIPLVSYRVDTQSTNRADLDNQIATQLNIGSESGFAPSAWQSYGLFPMKS